MSDLSRGEVNHLSISGGKDSTALLLWAVHESGYATDSLVATFCDTGNEHEFTYRYVRYLCERVHPIEWLRPAQDFYQLAQLRQRFPSARARFCTTELKIRPTREYLYGLLDQGCRVRHHTGVRAEESTARSSLAVREYDPDYLVQIYRPLLHWSLSEVLDIHRRYGVHPNPLYGLDPVLPWSDEPNPFWGHPMSRVGCYPCVLNRKADIRNLAAVSPGRIARLARQEEGFTNRCGFSSFFARSKVPVRYRTREVTTRSGQCVTVPTIADVVRWAQDDPDRADGEDEEVPCCPTRSGLCE